MSWSSAAHARRSASWDSRPSSSATSMLSARTRSEWPRVRRSWLFKAATSASKLVTAFASLVAARPVAASSAHARSLRTLPLRSATPKREGARSGNTNVIRRSAARGSARRASRSIAHKASVEAPRMTASHTTTRTPDGRDTVRLVATPTATEAAIGKTRTATRRAAFSTGRFRHLSAPFTTISDPIPTTSGASTSPQSKCGSRTRVRAERGTATRPVESPPPRCCWRWDGLGPVRAGVSRS